MVGFLEEQLLATDTSMVWLGVIVFAVVSAACFSLAFRCLSRARLMEDTPTAKIRSAPQGYVELAGEGELLGGTPIISPISGRRCLWYRYTVQEARDEYSGNYRGSRWRTVDSGESEGLFRLVDDSGDCVIDPEGANVHAARTYRWYGNEPRPGNSGPETYGRWSMALIQLLPLDFGRFRYSESLLMPGPLYAMGEFSTQGTDYQSDLKDDTAAILRSWKRDSATMRRLDTDGDGVVGMREWDAARRRAREEALFERSRSTVISTTHLLRRPNGGNRPYILSDYGHDVLVRRFRIQALILFAFFLATGVAAAWACSIRLIA